MSNVTDAKPYKGLSNRTIFKRFAIFFGLIVVAGAVSNLIPRTPPTMADSLYEANGRHKSWELTDVQRQQICDAGIAYLKAKLPAAKVDRCKGHKDPDVRGALAVITLVTKKPGKDDGAQYYVYLDGQGAAWSGVRLELVG